MKFNWGSGIFIFFSFFVVSMVYAVISTTKHAPQMVQKDYYALDMNYQERLERKQNVAGLSAIPQVSFDAGSQKIRVHFPEIALSGTAKCFRPATTRDDFSTKIENTTLLDIPAEGLATGRWHVELEWENEAGKKFFWEARLKI